MRLRDKVAIVAGAGSRGEAMSNGRASAFLLAKEGAKVVAVDINPKSAEDTVKSIKNTGGEAIAVEADVTKENEAKKVIDICVANYGKLDILFNNVGIEDGPNGIYNLTDADWDIVMNTNLKGIVFLSKYAVPYMKKAGGGSIINNSSMASFSSYNVYAYAASKAAVNSLTRCLAGGLGKYNIRANAVAPGYIATPMGAPIMRGELDNIIHQRVPLQRRGKPEDVANVVLFLASDESSFITGQVICVDGGMSIM